MIRSVVPAVAIAAALMCLPACGEAAGSLAATAGTGGVPSSAGVPVTTTRATVASNRKISAAEAARLLALAPAPPGATGIDPAGSALAQPQLGYFGPQSQVSRTRAWKVSLPYAKALRWVRTHPPAGLSRFGASGSSAGHGRRTEGYAYDGRQNPAWTIAQLQIAVAPLTSATSIIRADGIVVWLDPAPEKDDEPGRRLHLTAATGCPDTDEGVLGVTSTGTDLASRLLPAAAPTGGLVCRYAGNFGKQNTLTSTHRLDAASAAKLAAAVATQRLAHVTGGGRIPCPMGDGATTAVALTYPGREDVNLWLSTQGCIGIANGVIRAARGDVSTLEAALGSRKS